jgi:hypothetical protein
VREVNRKLGYLYTSEDEIVAKSKRFTTGDRMWWCRDFKKEGLTKPRNLLTILLEELEKKGYDVINPQFYTEL